MRLWPFSRRVRELELSEAAFDRWLRAHRPPFQWFLELAEDVQEALAQKGDAYAEDCDIAFGLTLLDPVRAHLVTAAEAGDEEAEGDLAAISARQMAERMGRHAAQNGAREPDPLTAVSFGGIGKRRRAAEERREAVREGSGFTPRLFGRLPDTAGGEK